MKAEQENDVGEPTEYAFPTMQEAEAFIRRNTPRPGPKLETLREAPMSKQTLRRNPFSRPVAVILAFFVVGGALAFAIG
jgi:hypothetical protein